MQSETLHQSKLKQMKTTNLLTLIKYFKVKKMNTLQEWQKEWIIRETRDEYIKAPHILTLQACDCFIMVIHVLVSILEIVILCMLLILMLWHRQAIFESKGDKLSSSAESRIRTHQGLSYVQDGSSYKGLWSHSLMRYHYFSEWIFCQYGDMGHITNSHYCQN